MPAANSTCSHCILDDAPLSFDRAAKLEHHCQQKHHKIVQQAYERGLQEGCNSPLVEGMIATHLQPVSVEMPPQNAVETETAYAHGFQDGKAAEKAVHDTVIKAMLDSHTRDIEAAFKRGKEHSSDRGFTDATTFANTSGQIAVGLTAGAICSGCGSPAIATSFGKHSKGSSPSS